jgi:hypothetical protein
MSQSREVTAKKPRGPGKRFEPGKSGNPGGRPKKTAEEIDLIEACKAKVPEALEVIASIMVKGSNERNRLAAAQAIIERAHGKPVQPVESSGPAGGPIETVQRIELVAMNADRPDRSA